MKTLAGFLYWTLLLLAGSGLYITGRLTIAKLSGQALPCGAENGCQVVAASAVSQLGSVPLSVLGAIAFAAIATMTISAGVNPSGIFSIRSLSTLATVCVLISCALTVYSLFVLRATCLWCLASNVTFALVFATVGAADAAKVNLSEHWLAKRFWLGSLAVAIVPVALWFVGNTASPASLAVDAVSLRSIETARLAPTSRAIRASTSSKYIVAFVDLQCLTCHKVLKGLLARLPLDFGLILRYRPLPGHRDSFEMARIVESLPSKEDRLRLLLSISNRPVSSIEELYALLKSLGISTPSPDALANAEVLVSGDLKLAEELRIDAVPVLIQCERNANPQPISYAPYISHLQSN